MGEYQLWLQYREIDQQLQTQLESLKTELGQLQEQVHLLELHDHSADNFIAQALAKHLRASMLASSPNTLAESDTLIVERVENDLVSDIVTEQSIETVSPALFAWSNLPNFDTGKIRKPYSKIVAPPPIAIPPPPHSEFDLLPKDMSAFFHQHASEPLSPTPPPTLPWWLHNGERPPSQHGSSPIDQQSIRTNQLVQRWLERWRKTSSDTPGSQEDQV